MFAEFRDLATAGSKEANYFLGSMYEDGTNGVRRDLARARQHYEQSVDDFGYLEGYLALARLHYHGIDGVPDFATSFKYYLHVAEKTGHLVACFMLGRMYHHGQGVERNLSLARHWYGRAIGQGSVYGVLNLAMLEAEEGRHLKGLALRLRAGLLAFTIRRQNRRDPRLRGG